MQPVLYSLVCGSAVLYLVIENNTQSGGADLQCTYCLSMQVNRERGLREHVLRIITAEPLPSFPCLPSSSHTAWEWDTCVARYLNQHFILLQTHKHYVCSTHKMLITQASIPSSYADSEWDIYYDILNWFILSGKLSTNTGSGSLTDSTTTYFWFWSWIAHSWNQLWRRSLPKIKLKIWAAGSWSSWAHHQQRN